MPGPSRSPSPLAPQVPQRAHATLDRIADALAAAERPFLLAVGSLARRRAGAPRSGAWPRRPGDHGIHRPRSGHLLPTPPTTSASRVASAPQGRWSSCARPTSCRRLRRGAQPVSRCASASSSPRARRCSRSMWRPRRPTPRWVGSCGGCRGGGRRDREPPALSRGGLVGLARPRRRRPSSRAGGRRGICSGWPTRPPLRRRTDRRAAAAEDRSWYRTAGTSSAGRTCTGPSPRPTA